MKNMPGNSRFTRKVFSTRLVNANQGKPGSIKPRVVMNAGIFLVLLVMSIPFVYSHELSVRSISGSSGVQGYSKMQDTLTIKVSASVQNEDIVDSSQVRLDFDGYVVPFDSCEKEGDVFVCVLSDPFFQSYESLDFSVVLYNDDNVEVARVPASLRIDGISPVVSEFKVDPLVTKGSVSASFTVEDYGLRFGSLDGCSGIKEVTVKLGDEVLFTEGAGANTCVKNKVFTHSFNDSGSICVSAQDFLGAKSRPVCKNVVVDNSGPVIDDLVIADHASREIRHTKKDKSIPSMVVVNIADDNGHTL